MYARLAFYLIYRMRFYEKVREVMKTGAAAIENLTGKVSEWKEQELKANEYGKENIETSKELDQIGRAHV